MFLLKSVLESLLPLFARLRVPPLMALLILVGTVVVLLPGKDFPDFSDVSYHSLLGQDAWHTYVRQRCARCFWMATVSEGHQG